MSHPLHLRTLRGLRGEYVTAILARSTSRDVHDRFERVCFQDNDRLSLTVLYSVSTNPFFLYIAAILIVGLLLSVLALRFDGFFEKVK